MCTEAKLFTLFLLLQKCDSFCLFSNIIAFLMVTVHFIESNTLVLKCRPMCLLISKSGHMEVSLGLCYDGKKRCVSVFKRDGRMDRVRMRPLAVMCPHSSDTTM